MQADDPTTDTLGELQTEGVDERFLDLDQLGVSELVSIMNALDAEVPAAVGRSAPQITEAIEAIIERMRLDGRLIYVGAGTAGRLGVIDAAEIPPTFSADPTRVVAVIAGGAKAITGPTEGAEDDSEAGRRSIVELDVGVEDAVVGIASSGRTPFTLGALEEARRRRALTVSLANVKDSQIGRIADHRIEIITGPELLSGSTRLRAGTSQKLVLNMISTIVMVQLGKTYGNLMVDLTPANEKLRDRATRITSAIAKVPADRARRLLEQEGFDVKRAVVMLSRQVDAATANALLARAAGRLRVALELP